MFLSDSKNHASLIQGIRHSGADKIIWQHNDMGDLEDKLREVATNGGTPCVVFESVYSMDGERNLNIFLEFLVKNYIGIIGN